MTSLSDHAKPPAKAPAKADQNADHKPAGSNGDAKDTKLGEAEFLRQEANRARRAMANTWAEAKAHLSHGVDPRAWTGEHPWIALSGAAVAGLFAAFAVIPSKEEQALKRLARIEQALSGAYQNPQSADAADRARDGQPRSGGILGSIGGELLKTIRPALASALSAVISAKTVKNDDGMSGADGAGNDAADGGAATAGGAAAGLDPSVNPDV